MTRRRYSRIASIAIIMSAASQNVDSFNRLAVSQPGAGAHYRRDLGPMDCQLHGTIASLEKLDRRPKCGRRDAARLEFSGLSDGPAPIVCAAPR